MTELILDTEEESQTEGRIPYDARQHNVKVLINLKISMFNAYIQEKYLLAFKFGKLIYYNCKAYCKDNSGVESQILNIKSNIFNKNPYLEAPLELFMDSLMVTYKDQFMQLAEKEEGSFNAADALGDD